MDEEFRRELPVRDLYNFRSRSYWLRRLENHVGRNLSQSKYTIEHILPQNENLSKAWRDALGRSGNAYTADGWIYPGQPHVDWLQCGIQRSTLCGKARHAWWLQESPLRFNQGLGQLAHWNEATIVTGARRLGEIAVAVWAAPQLDTKVLDAYRPRAEPKPGYAIEDHPHLLGGVGRDLFEAFRKEVLALDPVVTEEFLKFYVAYKAETTLLTSCRRQSVCVCR